MLCQQVNFSHLVNTFPLIRTIIKRERTAGMYRSSSAFLSKFTSLAPTILIQIIVMVIPVYWIIGMDPRGYKFGTFVGITTLHTFAAATFGLTIGSAVKNVQVGQIITPLIAVLFIVFGGLFANLDSIGTWISWIQYISPVANTNKALCQNEFYENTFECGIKVKDKCIQIDGEEIVKNASLDKPEMGVVVGVNVAFLAVCLILGIMFFTRTTKPMIRLK
eukprot:NODE_6_length_70510_cov_1.054395.p40 type:complete len:220 gc:universal NODE_6_length_70510_cov_1.054395:44925-44266(-)